MEHEIKIIAFDDSLKKHFAELNVAWISKYFAIEPKDEQVLSNPQQFILQNGGFIFFATFNNNIAGTAALIKTGEKVYELAKMAVSDAYQGNKIGNALLHYCIAKAKQLDAGKIILYSNTILGAAIHLYKKFGFKEVPLENADFKRSNIKMELNII